MISVIIPCYNCAGTIEATIQSVLEQQVNTSLIALDDGSKDQTLEVLGQFSSQSKILTGPNQGVSGTRNKGIQLVQDDWVQFLDSDDLLAPNTLDDRLRCARETGADVVVTDWADFAEERQIAQGVVIEKSADWDRLNREGAEVACATSFWAPPAAVLYRRAIVEKIGGFRTDLPIIQDARFLFDAAHAGAKFAHVRSIGAYYRVADQSLSRSNPTKFWLDILTNIQQIEAIWQARGSLLQEERDALLGVFESAANSLLRCGNHEFKIADSHFQALGGKPALKYQVGKWLAKAFGPQNAARAFQLGRTIKARTD
jgi:glycosyltransferase involved in cell wall biosynthesis